MGKVELGEPGYEGQILEYDENYSGKSFIYQDLSDRKDMDGITIYSSIFASEIPDTKIFSDNMKNVRFVNCNLDNIIIPPGNILQNCSNRRFKIQNDGNDWIIDNSNKPIKPLNDWVFTKFNVPVPDPKNIPTDKVTVRIDLLAVAKANKDKTNGN